MQLVASKNIIILHGFFVGRVGMVMTLEVVDIFQEIHCDG